MGETMEIRYCLSFTKGTLAQAVEAIRTQISVYQYFELWLDLLEESSLEEVCALVRRYPHRVIALFRRPLLASIHTPFEERCAWYRALAQEPLLWDMDYPSQKDDVTALLGLDARPSLILSHHDYEKTPSDQDLATLFDTMKQHQPEILKLAAFCQEPEDAVRLLSWQLSLKKQGHDVIVLGMGPHGAVTRVFGTLWGNAMIFAPPSLAEASAPGQLTQGQLREIFALLGEPR
ncbi:MAG: type I 3-dehydroquinate dehydratase [Myxococcales bacterium]|nr:type I 3-dehydroquinate dehydratase [Myxococcales bacterium]